MHSHGKAGWDGAVTVQQLRDERIDPRCNSGFGQGIADEFARTLELDRFGQCDRCCDHFSFTGDGSKSR